MLPSRFTKPMCKGHPDQGQQQTHPPILPDWPSRVTSSTDAHCRGPPHSPRPSISPYTKVTLYVLVCPAPNLMGAPQMGGVGHMSHARHEGQGAFNLAGKQKMKSSQIRSGKTWIPQSLTGCLTSGPCFLFPEPPAITTS